MAEGWEGGRGGLEAQARRAGDKRSQSVFRLGPGPPSLSQLQGKTQTENTKDHKPGKTQKIPKCLCAVKVFLPKQRKQAWLKWHGEGSKECIRRTWLCWSWVRDEINVHVACRDSIIFCLYFAIDTVEKIYVCRFLLICKFKFCTFTMNGQNSDCISTYQIPSSGPILKEKGKLAKSHFRVNY